MDAVLTVLHLPEGQATRAVLSRRIDRFVSSPLTRVEIVQRQNSRSGGITKPTSRDVTASGTGAVEEITTTLKVMRNVSRHVLGEAEEDQW